MAEEDNFASQVEDKVEETTFKDDKDAKKIRKRAQKSKVCCNYDMNIYLLHNVRTQWHSIITHSVYIYDSSFT